MRKLFFLTIFFYISLQVFGQEINTMVVFGKVVDSAGNPIEGVSVADENSLLKSTTDNNGLYDYTINSLPTTLSFSFVGYKTIKISVVKETLKTLKNGKLSMDIQMERESYELPGVDVSAKLYEQVYKNPKAWVTDFDFISDTSILLLMEEGNDHFLRIIDEKNTVLLDYKIHLGEANLFKDCYGNIHALTKDSSYQIYIFDSLGLYIYPASPIKLFYEQLLPCAHYDTENLYFMYLQNFNQSACFVKINKENKNKKLLHYIIDKEGSENIQKTLTKLLSLGGADAYDEPGGSNPFLELLIDNEYLTDRKKDDLYSWLIFSKNHPVRANLFGTLDSIYIFDLSNYELLVFGKNNSNARIIKLDSNALELKKCEIFMDYKRERFFIKNIKDGIVYLKEINPSNLSMRTGFHISEHIFPQKIKIRGDYVYYLYGGATNNGMKYLYREKIVK